MSESETLARVRVAVSALGARLFRRHVGLFYAEDGTPVRIGTPGEVDLQGWVPVRITPIMVGAVVPVYCALEVKSLTGRITKQQTAFLLAVRKAGGIGAVVRTEQDAITALGGLG